MMPIMAVLIPVGWLQNTGAGGVKDGRRTGGNRSDVLVFFITQTNETSIIIVSTFN